MEHNAIRENLPAFYDGELGYAVRQEVKAHLGVCQECREAYQNWAKTAKVFFRAPKPQTSEFFVRCVMDSIHALELETSKQKAGWNLPLSWLVPVVGIAAMLLFVPAPSLPLMSTEALLTNGRADTASQWIFSKESLKTDEILGFVLEGPS